MPVPVFSSGEVLTAANMNQVGLWLVKSQAVGTGVSSVTVTDAFTSEFENYLVTLSGGTVSVSNADIAVQLRTGSTTSATGYYSSLIYWSGAAINTFNLDNSTQWLNAGGGATTSARMRCEVSGPFLAQPTGFFAVTPRNDIRGTSSGFHSPSTSYNSIVVTPNGATLTGGTIRVYGYRN